MITENVHPPGQRNFNLLGNYPVLSSRTKRHPNTSLWSVAFNLGKSLPLEVTRSILSHTSLPVDLLLCTGTYDLLFITYW